MLHSKYHVFSKTPKIFNYYNTGININEVVAGKAEELMRFFKTS